MHETPARAVVPSPLRETTTESTVQPHYTYRVQYSTVQYSTVQYSTVQYSTVQYSTLHYITLRYITLHYTALRYTTPHTTLLDYAPVYQTTSYHNTPHTYDIRSTYDIVEILSSRPHTGRQTNGQANTCIRAHCKKTGIDK